LPGYRFKMLMLLIRRRGLSSPSVSKCQSRIRFRLPNFPAHDDFFPSMAMMMMMLIGAAAAVLASFFPSLFAPAFPRVFPQPGPSTLAALA